MFIYQVLLWQMNDIILKSRALDMYRFLEQWPLTLFRPRMSSMFTDWRLKWASNFFSCFFVWFFSCVLGFGVFIQLIPLSLYKCLLFSLEVSGHLLCSVLLCHFLFSPWILSRFPLFIEILQFLPLCHGLLRTFEGNVGPYPL